MNKEYYICLRETQEKEKIALYYSYDIGKRRIYRSDYPIKPYIFEGTDINKTLRLYKYKNIKNAQDLCDCTNQVYGYKGNEEFKPFKIEGEL